MEAYLWTGLRHSALRSPNPFSPAGHWEAAEALRFLFLLLLLLSSQGIILDFFTQREIKKMPSKKKKKGSVLFFSLSSPGEQPGSLQRWEEFFWG